MVSRHTNSLQRNQTRRQPAQYLLAFVRCRFCASFCIPTVPVAHTQPIPMLTTGGSAARTETFTLALEVALFDVTPKELGFFCFTFFVFVFSSWGSGAQQSLCNRLACHRPSLARPALVQPPATQQSSSGSFLSEIDSPLTPAYPSCSVRSDKPADGSVCCTWEWRELLVQVFLLLLLCLCEDPDLASWR